MVSWAAKRLPRLEVEVAARPITRTVLRVTLTVTAAFEWADRYHGTMEPWWVWVEDAETASIYHKVRASICHRVESVMASMVAI